MGHCASRRKVWLLRQSAQLFFLGVQFVILIGVGTCRRGRGESEYHLPDPPGVEVERFGDAHERERMVYPVGCNPRPRVFAMASFRPGIVNRPEQYPGEKSARPRHNVIAPVECPDPGPLFHRSEWKAGRKPDESREKAPARTPERRGEVAEGVRPVGVIVIGHTSRGGVRRFFAVGTRARPGVLLRRDRRAGVLRGDRESFEHVREFPEYPGEVRHENGH